MADRSEYLANYYLKNKKKMDKKSKDWHKNKKKELGKEGYKAWKKAENDKYRLKHNS